MLNFLVKLCPAFLFHRFAGLFVLIHGSASFSLISSLTAVSIFSRMPRGLRLLFKMSEQ
nr:MAG TPA: hypothetical protein [Caudoviricetes sp.]